MSDTFQLRHRVNLKPFEDGDVIHFSTYRRVSSDERVQIRYIELREAGESHNMAEMLATRKFPGLKTDSIFNEGRCNGNQFEKTPAQGEYYRKIAEAQGVNTVGRTYIAGLAAYPGDPRAWISGRGDVLRIAKEENYTVRGYVEHAGHEAEPAPDVEIAPDIVDREVQHILQSVPGSDPERVRERVIELRTGKVDINPLLVDDHNFDGLDDAPGLAT